MARLGSIFGPRIADFTEFFWPFGNLGTFVEMHTGEISVVQQAEFVTWLADCKP